MKKVFIWMFIFTIIYFGIDYFLKYQNTQKQLQSERILEIEKTFLFSLNEKNNQIIELERQSKQKKDSERVYTIVVGGDLMLDRGVEKKLKNLGKDYDFSFDLIREYLKSAEYVFANLEGSLSDVGYDLGNKYSFRFDLSLAQALADAGFDIVSLANNHILDWGKDSLCATTKNLSDVGIKSIGAGCNRLEAEQPEIVTFGNTRVAFLAYTEFHLWAKATENSAGISEYNLKKIGQRVADLKNSNEVDLVFVSMHWGEEYKDRAPDRIVKNAHQLINAGVDVIIGHHPHVDQEIERYGSGWIIYSLGNFVFDQSWSENTMQGLLVEINIKNKKVMDVIPRPIQLNSNYQPELVN